MVGEKWKAGGSGSQARVGEKGTGGAAGEGNQGQGGVGKQDREGFNDGMTGATLQVGKAAPALLSANSGLRIGVNVVPLQPEPVGRLVPKGSARLCTLG